MDNLEISQVNDVSSEATTKVRSDLVSSIRARLDFIQRNYHEELVELSYVQSGALLIDFHGWRSRRSQEIIQALCSGHLDPDDLSMISEYMSGIIPTELFFAPSGSAANVVASETDADSESEDRGLDESSIYRLAMHELNVLKRVVELKKAGLWSVSENILDAPELATTDSTPSMSSLAPPPENTTRVFTDYLFVELRWLAEDFKRERQWKKSSAKKLALAAVKAYREKTERSLKAEREEALRVRKLCGAIARMVRDWWRQIDKIVQAKQQARLTVKRQQAMTTHLGRVLETTEEYTRWLTEGITGAGAANALVTGAPISDSTSDMPESEALSSNPKTSPSMTTEVSTADRKGHQKRRKTAMETPTASSDSEFTADEETLAAAEDDEETIAREEEEMKTTTGDPEVSAAAELAQLAADADCPIEDLIPPGYLEACLVGSPCKPEESTNEVSDEHDKAGEDSDHSYKAGASGTGSDDESTIDAQERHERQLKRAIQKQDSSEPTSPSSEKLLDKEEEIAQLEREATMPLEDLIRQLASQTEDFAPMNVDTQPSDSELTSSTQGSDTTTSSGEESDDDRTTLTDTSTSSSSSEASLRELLSEETDKLPGSTITEENIEAKQPAVAEPQELTNLSNDPSHEEAQKNLETLTAEALQAQPTGNTLASDNAKVVVPFLLTGGSLREYQLVGLTWLAAIFQKRLNGILADEMGLGKTIQTIALLAYLACEHGIWGPHLIVVPTSVILNWEIEFKRWCPGFKILTYFGHVKERRERRKGWTKTNAFHVCITSYRLAIQDAAVFKRKKWKYLILDEAQNIKNFKSQRWQTLLTFNSQRRLLLTGTPLQNSLMELWSLMHFLMPNIFQSHRDFQEWFASPLTGMIEGNSEYNEQLVARLHKVLRPFLLRRLKADVERQMPKKFEHIVMCRLSRRQRFLYDDFMSLTSTRETLKSGQFLSVMNVLMQLRKVCNHPNLFETRPIISSFHVADHLLQWDLPRLLAEISHPFLILAPPSNGGASLVSSASAFTEPCLDWLDRAGAAFRLLGQMSNLAEMTRDLPTFVAHRCHNLCAQRNLIQLVDTMGVVDDVQAQRKSILAIAKTKKLDVHSLRRTTPLFPRNALKEAFDESIYPVNHSKDGFLYPNLPNPHTVTPVFFEVSPPARPGNNGMPKSVLRSRGIERQRRLGSMARINERRCDVMDTMDDQQFGTRIGPDVVYLITRMLQNSGSSATRCSESVYPGLTEGPSHCRRSLASWPSRSHVRNRTSCQSRIEQAACIPSETSEASGTLRPFVKEAPWERHSSWDQDCISLRMLLSNPADHLESLSDELQRFAFFVPAAISSGFRMNVSHARYQWQWSRQEERLSSFLRSECLPSVCIPKNLPATRGVTAVRNSFDHIPLSPQAWLLPVQLHRISTACRIQFPDPRLIQYDCGKLQRLDLLLRELKAGSHRVLIFTQMARMLDILEQFLAYHGHRYLRLDGTTKVEQRQVLMERFNQDASIFVFILSTRSGGLGVNLTGADTVIFYDSDWNPTMDAQAQDRCHRIGQTRDVHIYRLISELTVEENILRKANQKRFLSDVAIEGGRFTTAFFKQNTIDELFAEPSGLQDLVLERQKQEALKLSLENAPSPDPAKENSDSNPTPILVTRSGRHVRARGDAATVAALAPPPPIVAPVAEETQLAALLEACEDENDRIAAKRALDEAQADLAEFDETIPLDDGNQLRVDGASTRELTSGGNGVTDEPDPLTQYALKKQKILAQTSGGATTSSETTVADSQSPEEGAEQIVERELAEFEAALRPIERFGIRNLEEQREYLLTKELEQAEVQLSESKEAWRLDQLKALHVADEERAEIEEDDMLYCYGNYNPQAQLAELERLERLIAQEEKEALNPEPTRPRGRMSFSGRSAHGTTKAGAKRGYVSGKHARVTDSSATEAGLGDDFVNERVGPSKRGTSAILDNRPNYAESSDSDDQRFISDNESTSRRPTKVRRPDEHQTLQRWESEEFSSDGLPSEEEEEDWGAHFSRRLANTKQRESTNKRKRSTISFFRPSKVPRVDTNSRLPTAVPNQPTTRVEPGPGMFRRERFRPNEGPARLNTAVPLLETHIPAGTPAKQFVAKELGIPDRDQPTSNVSAAGLIRGETSSVNRETVDRSLFDSLNVPQLKHRFPSSTSTASSMGSGTNFKGRLSDSSLRSSSHGPELQDAFRTDGLSPSVNQTMSPSRQPRLRPALLRPSTPRQPVLSTYDHCVPWTTSEDSHMIPVPQHSTIYTRKPPPPSAQIPPEPVIPVQSVLNGMRESIPAGQLFTPSGQPVFVITRQMKTDSGEVYQQRFTHPVIPPPQFVRVVNRLSQPTSSNIPFIPRPSSTTVRTTSPLLTSVGRLIPLTPSPISKGSVFHNTQTVNTRDTSTHVLSGVSTANVVPIDPTSSTRIVTVSTTHSSTIPVIRRINCDMAKPTPVLRLINAETYQSPATARSSVLQTVSTATPVVRSLTPSTLGGTQLQQPQHFTVHPPAPRSMPTQLLRARFLSPSDR